MNDTRQQAAVALESENYNDVATVSLSSSNSLNSIPGSTCCASEIIIKSCVHHCTLMAFPGGSGEGDGMPKWMVVLHQRDEENFACFKEQRHQATSGDEGSSKKSIAKETWSGSHQRQESQRISIKKRTPKGVLLLIPEFLLGHHDKASLGRTREAAEELGKEVMQ